MSADRGFRGGVRLKAGRSLLGGDYILPIRSNGMIGQVAFQVVQVREHFAEKAGNMVVIEWTTPFQNHRGRILPLPAYL